MADKFNIDTGVEKTPNLMPSSAGVGGNPTSLGSALSSFGDSLSTFFTGLENRKKDANVAAINASVNADNIMPGTVDRTFPANPDANSTINPELSGKTASGESLIPQTGGTGESPQTLQTTLPPDVQSGMARLGNAHQAFKQGKLEMSNFWNMVSTQQRDMISKNPYYAKEIREAFKNQYGFDPQHKYLEEVDKYQQRKETELKDEEKRWRDTRAEGATFGIPVDQLRAGDNNPQARVIVENSILQRKAQNAEREAKLKAIELKSKENQDVEGDYFKEANKAVSQEIHNVFTDTTNSMKVNGITYQDLVQERAKAQSDGQITPEEQKNLMNMWSQIEAPLMLRVDKSLLPYRDKISDPKKLQEIRGEIENQVKFYREAVVGNHVGILDYNEKSLKSIEAGDAQAAISQSDTIRKLSVLNKVGGPAVANLFATQGISTLKDDASKVALTPIGVNIASGSPMGVSISEGTKNLNPKQKASVSESVVNTSIKILTDPNTHPEMVKNIAGSMFGQGNVQMLQSFTPESRMKVYTKLVSPEMTKRMEELGKTDPQALEQYKQWSATNFYSLTKSYMDTLKNQTSGDQSKNNFVIGFDGSQFTVSYNPEHVERGIDGAFYNKKLGGYEGNNWLTNTRIQPSYAEQNTLDSVREMNRALTSFYPVAAIGKKDTTVSTVLEPMFKGLGLSGEVRNDLDKLAKAYSSYQLDQGEQQANGKKGATDFQVKKISELEATSQPTQPSPPIGEVTQEPADKAPADKASADKRGSVDAKVTTKDSSAATIENSQSTPYADEDKGRKVVDHTEFTDKKGRTYHQVKYDDGTWSRLREAPFNSKEEPKKSSETEKKPSQTPTQNTVTKTETVQTARKSNPLGLKEQTIEDAMSNPMVAGYIKPTDGSYNPEDKYSTSTKTVSSNGGVADSNYPDLNSYMRKTMGAESGGSTTIKNARSSATGLFQFTSKTWKGMIKNHPDLGLTPNGRTDPEQQKRAMAAFTKDNEAVLKKAGIPVTDGTRYLAHFAGSGGAVAVYSGNPDATVEQTLGSDVIKANPFLKGKTNAWLRNWANKKMKV